MVKRVNPSAKAVINGSPGQLKITNNKYKKNYNNNNINNPKNRLQINGEIKTMYNVAKKNLYKNKSFSFVLKTTNDSTSFKNGRKLLKAWAPEICKQQCRN